MNLEQTSLWVGVAGGIVGILGGLFSAIWTLLQNRERVAVRLRPVTEDRDRVASFAVEVVNLGVPAVCVTFVGFRRCRRVRDGGGYVLDGMAPSDGDVDADAFPIVLDHGRLCRVRVNAGAMRRVAAPVQPVVRLSSGRVFTGRRVTDTGSFFELGRTISADDGDVLVVRK